MGIERGRGEYRENVFEKRKRKRGIVRWKESGIGRNGLQKRERELKVNRERGGKRESGGLERGRVRRKGKNKRDEIRGRANHGKKNTRTKKNKDRRE